MGIQPDLIVCRTDRPLDTSIREKISLFCNVPPDCVIENRTVDELYQAPLMLEESRFSQVVCRQLGLETPPPDLAAWAAMLRRLEGRTKRVTIALVGKYVKLHDAYLSVAEALRHAGGWLDSFVDIQWVDAEDLTAETAPQLLGDAQGIIAPGGFGSRGIEGILLAADYARRKEIPYLGICLGMQLAVIAFTRSVLGWPDAYSTEFLPETPHPVIGLMADQEGVEKGGTMRLGAYPCVLRAGSLLAKLYGQTEIRERHRHRYECAASLAPTLEKYGMDCTGLSPDRLLVEAVELRGHPFYVGVQFHPEFKSRPNRPQPVFLGFVKAALDRQG